MLSPREFITEIEDEIRDKARDNDLGIFILAFSAKGYISACGNIEKMQTIDAIMKWLVEEGIAHEVPITPVKNISELN